MNCGVTSGRQCGAVTLVSGKSRNSGVGSRNRSGSRCPVSDGRSSDAEFERDEHSPRYIFPESKGNPIDDVTACHGQSQTHGIFDGLDLHEALNHELTVNEDSHLFHALLARTHWYWKVLG